MSSLLALRDEDTLDDYHRARLHKHGRLYILLRKCGMFRDLYEAKSIATGVVCTLDKHHVEEIDHAAQS